MKTVKDVYAVYKEWPDESTKCYYVNNVMVFIGDVGYMLAGYLICTREQYEQYKAEQENSVETKCDWYDYDKGEAVGFPSDNTECEVSNCGNDYEWCKVVFMGNTICLVDHKTYNEQHYHLGSVKFRPLDHDKYKVKVAPMDWGVKSGIDFEFSDNKDDWFTDFLLGIKESHPKFKYETVFSEWKHCRPRMNHNHVLDGVQFARIPSCFAIEILYTFDDSYVVEFTGLKDGYAWEGE